MTLHSDHSEVTIQTLWQLYKARHLNLSPAFQRQSVWSRRDREQLVLSVLAGLPLPTIYLYRNSGHGGSNRYDVIDGKQRIETLLYFMGKGPLAPVEDDLLWIRTSFDDDEPIEWWAWKHLSSASKNRFLGTRLHTIEVDGELSEIIELFVRINSTGMRLTSAERRHARFLTEPALKAAQGLADEKAGWLKKHRVVSEAATRRSKHVELMCELLLSVHAGAPLNKKAKIDELISGGGVDQRDIKEAVAGVRRALKLIDTIVPDLADTRFSKLADFYTLTLLLHRLRADGLAVSAHNSVRNELAGNLLRQFALGVDEVAELQKKIKQPAGIYADHMKYLMTVREGTDSYANRSRREAILRKVLEGVFEPLDTQRLFNATQRRILWHAAKDRRCDWCGGPIARLEDAHVDHITAYIKGGLTDLANAQLLHKKHNLAKGAR